MKAGTRALMLAMAAIVGCGCTQQEEAQRALISEMRSGVKEVSAWSDERQTVIDGFYAGRRRALDDAFDADVNETTTLDRPWVIEHRKAYVMALEVAWKAQQASREAHLQAKRNLVTIDQGLERLAWMSQMRQGWFQKAQEMAKEVGNEGH